MRTIFPGTKALEIQQRSLGTAQVLTQPRWHSFSGTSPGTWPRLGANISGKGVALQHLPPRPRLQVCLSECPTGQSFTHSFIKYLLSTCCVPISTAETGETS